MLIQMVGLKHRLSGTLHTAGVCVWRGGGRMPPRVATATAAGSLAHHGHQYSVPFCVQSWSTPHTCQVLAAVADHTIQVQHERTLADTQRCSLLDAAALALRVEALQRPATA